MKNNIIIDLIIVLILTLVITSCQPNKKDDLGKSTTIDLLGDSWSGQAIAYSGYREGQHPDQDIYPSKSEILKILKLLKRIGK